MTRWTIAHAAAVLLAAGLTGCMPVRSADDDFPEPSGGRPAPAASAEPDRPAPRDALYLVLDLSDRRLYVRRKDGAAGRARQLDSYPVAVGRKGYDTPTGRFAVTEKIVDPDFLVFDWGSPKTVVRRIAPGPTNPLGLRWIGFTSGYGWSIGFHGTPNPELLGQAVSHGCVRMRNSDVVKLYDRVRIGTPVVVEP